MTKQSLGIHNASSHAHPELFATKAFTPPTLIDPRTGRALTPEIQLKKRVAELSPIQLVSINGKLHWIRIKGVENGKTRYDSLDLKKWQEVAMATQRVMHATHQYSEATGSGVNLLKDTSITSLEIPLSKAEPITYKRSDSSKNYALSTPQMHDLTSGTNDLMRQLRLSYQGSTSPSKKYIIEATLYKDASFANKRLEDHQNHHMQFLSAFDDLDAASYVSQRECADNPQKYTLGDGAFNFMTRTLAAGHPSLYTTDLVDLSQQSSVEIDWEEALTKKYSYIPLRCISEAKSPSVKELGIYVDRENRTVCIYQSSGDELKQGSYPQLNEFLKELTAKIFPEALELRETTGDLPFVINQSALSHPNQVHLLSFEESGNLPLRKRKMRHQDQKRGSHQTLRYQLAFMNYMTNKTQQKNL